MSSPIATYHAPPREPITSLQNYTVVLLRGVHPQHKHLCAIGWISDDVKPSVQLVPLVGDVGVTLQEPMYCLIRPGQGGPTANERSISFLMPETEVSIAGHFDEYTNIDFYEGVTSLAAAYFTALSTARQFVPKYNIGWITTQAEPHEKKLPPAMR